jgi:D-alanine-D-alanine ligase
VTGEAGSRRLRLAVLYGGRSAEHEVSVVSARSIIAAADPATYEVIPVALTRDGRWLLPTRGPADLPDRPGVLPAVEEAGVEVVLVARPEGPALRSLEGDGGWPVDVVFPVLHGPYGEDGTVQGLLELVGVPYVGAGVLASALGMDKEVQKRLFAAAGLPVVEHVAVRAAEWRRSPEGAAERAERAVGLPCFTKPARLGSSVGIRKCRTPAELAEGIALALRHDEKALVERAVAARELECGVLGNEEPEASVVGEIVPGREFYDYEAKYLVAGSECLIPAPVPSAVAEEVRRLALAAFRAIDAAGMARVDFFYEEPSGRLYVNEINTIPGFTPISMYPKLWEASGVPYPKLVDRLVELALERRPLARGAPPGR